MDYGARGRASYFMRGVLGQEDREFQGTGIGLATVARVIQRHGGSLVARSRVNEGAAFAFSLLEPIQSPENVLDQLSNISVELLPA